MQILDGSFPLHVCPSLVFNDAVRPEVKRPMKRLAQQFHNRHKATLLDIGKRADGNRPSGDRRSNEDSPKVVRLLKSVPP